MRLIDADALKKELNFVYSCAYIESKSKEGIASDIIDIINNALTVDKRPQGEWIDHGNHIECNQCGVWFLKDHLIRKSFCPNCGAKMQMGSKNETTFDDYLKKQLKDPEFRKEFEKLCDEEKKDE